tara:strand:+ start:164 stop:679 length:516 start_codon:yes stop_codon:yes gene_type:complete
MAEGILMGAALGGGSAMLTGNDPLKGAALGGAMGGATAGFGGAGVASGAGATMPAHLAQTGAQQAASNAAAGSMFSGVGDTVGQGFDYMNDMTGMENRDWTQMGIKQGMNAMQPEPQQQLQAAPMGQGISRPNVDLSQNTGSLLSSNPQTSGPGGMAMTQKDYELLKQGLL